MEDLIDPEPWPSPIAAPLRAYQSEAVQFRKLHRLVDVFEVMVKYVAVIALQNFYAADLHLEQPEVDLSFRYALRRPSLGHWVGILRESLRPFGEAQSKLFYPPLYQFYYRTQGPRPKQQRHISQALDSLLQLRNQLAHGATLVEDEAGAYLFQYGDLLQQLLSAGEPLCEMPLLLLERYLRSGRFEAAVMRGPQMPSGHQHIIVQTDRDETWAEHLVVQHSDGGAYLDLHPLLIYTGCQSKVPVWDEEHRQVMGTQACGECSTFCFNDFGDESKLTYLGYERGHRSLYKRPDPLAEAFVERFPPAQDSPVDWFEGFIEHQIEHFTGRVEELTALDAFVGSDKPVFVVLGPPGIGKTTLLAKWAFEHNAIRTFVREGDRGSYDPVGVLGTLARQVAKRYDLRGNLPRSDAPVEHQQHLMELLGQASDKSSEPVVLIVDGLDEAVRAAVASPSPVESLLDWLPDPARLPANVRWIVSSRAELSESAAWRGKYGRDKAERLQLSGLRAADVRALLYTVCSKYDVLEMPEYVEAIVRKSEGNALYLRMLADDLVEGRVVLGSVDSLPAGIIDYFDRILRSIEACEGAANHVGAEQVIPVLRRNLQKLVDGGHLSAEQLEAQLRAALQDLGSQSMRLLALLVIALDSLSMGDAGKILELSTQHIADAFEVLEPYLVKASSDGYRLFHSSLRDYFLNLDNYRADGVHPYKALIVEVRSRLLAFCADWRDHSHPYAIRHYAAHLLETGAWDLLEDLLLVEQERKPLAEARYEIDYAYTGYLADLGVVEAHAQNVEDLALWLQCRLVRTTLSKLNQLSANLLTALVTAGTTAGRWPVEVALDYVRAGYAPPETLAQLAQRMDNPPYEDLLAVIHDLAAGEQRELAVRSLLPALPARWHDEAQALLPLWFGTGSQEVEEALEPPGTVQVLSSADWAVYVQDALESAEQQRMDKMAVLVANIQESTPPEMLETIRGFAQTIPDPWHRAYYLVKWAVRSQRLGTDRVGYEALAAIRAVTYNLDMLDKWKGHSIKVPAELRDDLRVAKAISDPYVRLEQLAALLSKFDQIKPDYGFGDLEGLLWDAGESVLTCLLVRVQLALQLAPVVTDQVRCEVIEMVVNDIAKCQDVAGRYLWQWKTWGDAPADKLSSWSLELDWSALMKPPEEPTVRQETAVKKQARFEPDILALFPKDAFGGVKTTSTSVDVVGSLPEVIAWLLPWLEGRHRANLSQRFMTSLDLLADAIRNNRWSYLSSTSESLDRLLTITPEPELCQVIELNLSLGRQIGDEDALLSAYVSLAPYLADGQLARVHEKLLDRLKFSQDKRQQSHLLRDLVRLTAFVLGEQGVTAYSEYARRLVENGYSELLWHSLTAVSSYLGPEHCAVTLPLIPQMDEYEDQTEALRIILPRLPSQHLPEALEVARGIPLSRYAEDRADLLCELLARDAGVHSSEIATEALIAVACIERGEPKLKVLAKLYALTEEPLRSRILEALYTLTHGSSQFIEALKTLPEPLLSHLKQQLADSPQPWFHQLLAAERSNQQSDTVESHWRSDSCLADVIAADSRAEFVKAFSNAATEIAAHAGREDVNRFAATLAAVEYWWR